ncbi:MAG: OmpH family outer membrane protein [Alistipes sp.]|nr:OmpH family outer membrane protein [Alistipes sp.]
MKKSLLSILAMSLMMVSCGGAKSESKVEVESAEPTEVQGVECVASGDVVFLDLDYIMAASKFYATEGVALETKMQNFQQKSLTVQEGWAKKEQNLANEYNKLQAEAAKLEEDYAKGLITTLNAQKKQEEIQKKANTIQTKMNNFQTTVQTEGQDLQKEEQALSEEQMVLMNRFKEIATKAIDEINADGRYKMIINAVSVVDADPSLNISDLVLERVDALYEAGELK